MGHVYFKFVKNLQRHHYFASKTSSPFLYFVTPRNSNLSNFNRIKLILALGVDFGALISNFDSKSG